jgi:carotenoid cleavage dioxygenase
LEKAILWYFDDYNSKKHNYYLKNNYASVHETDPASNLSVVGTIPECLNGEFVRVGPNPKFVPVAAYHWFDGDGMIHGLKIKDGNATYVSRYVKTSRLQQEEKYGAAKFLKAGDLIGKKGLLYVQLSKLRHKLGVLDDSNGRGPGNTALVYHNKKLLALHEGDKPYAIRVLEDGDLETLGRFDYGARLDHPFTAHPKVDPTTGEMFTFGYQLEQSHIYYRVVSRDGVMKDPVLITLPQAVMMHDFAITENYAIFMDLPVVCDGKKMFKGGFLFNFDEKKEARLGVLPRYATNESQIRWFTIPSCFIFHNANAWEEGDEIVLVSCRFDRMELERAMDEVTAADYSKPYPFEFRMNMKTGEVSQKQLSVLSADFPRVNEEYTGRKTRYMYGAIMDYTGSKVLGVGKFDLTKEPETNPKSLEEGGDCEGSFVYGPGKFGGEAIFVPRNPGMKGSEDDGYLIVFVHDENDGKSEVVIIDAKTMAPEPVAVVTLPTRVPYGFHALFVTEEQLKNQSYN